jgi:NAD(P)-dependent dehydrogenase (short-subunit alcohol dehydrogenase family)
MTEQRTVIITGAGGGIGQAAVKHFDEQGWQVIGIDRREFPGNFPEGGLFVQGDVSLPEDWDRMVHDIELVTGQVDCLVNNAGVQITKPVLETTLEEWDRVLDSNLRSVFLGVKRIYPFLLENQGGSIVNISSVHAVATSRDIAAYAASKGGLLALTRAMAIEFAPDGIRVNTVLPGAVDTLMLREGLNRDHAGEGSLDDRLENLANKTVSGTIGRPEEIASVIYFLADGTQSSFITGQPVIVDGGATVKLSTE